MYFSDEAVHLDYPILEATEIEELLSLFQPGNSGSPNSGSEETSHRPIYTVDERKYKRMVSNRESARRSRFRKKRHLENLTNQVNRLRLENRDIKNRLGLVAHQCHVALRENDRLRSESFALWARLSDLCRILQTTQSSTYQLINLNNH